MFVLDTDHVVFLQRRSGLEYQRLQQRIDAYAPQDFFVSIVTFHEQAMGWNCYLQRARTDAEIVHGYQQFGRVIEMFSVMQSLPFDLAAAHAFEDLRRQRVRIGTMDLRIAASALTRGLVVLTRNTVDFARVPGLQFEDWTH